jgi:hypothetical protein
MSFRVGSILKLSLLWTTSALALGIVLSNTNLLRYRNLASHGVATTGSGTTIEPANRQSVGYSYRVSGRVFSGKGNTGAGNPEFALLHVGEEVSVSYWTDAPYVSWLGDPDDLLRNETLGVSRATIIFPAFAIAVFAARYSAFRPWLTN